MNFNFGQDTFYREVTFNIAKGGGNVKYTFTVTFEFKESDEINTMLDEDNRIQAFLCQVVKGWKNLKDADKAEVPYSPEAAEELFGKLGAVRTAVYREFLSAIGGTSHSKRGN